MQKAGHLLLRFSCVMMASAIALTHYNGHTYAASGNGPGNEVVDGAVKRHTGKQPMQICLVLDGVQVTPGSGTNEWQASIRLENDCGQPVVPVYLVGIMTDTCSVVHIASKPYREPIADPAVLADDQSAKEYHGLYVYTATCALCKGSKAILHGPFRIDVFASAIAVNPKTKQVVASLPMDGSRYFDAGSTDKDCL